MFLTVHRLLLQGHGSDMSKTAALESRLNGVSESRMISQEAHWGRLSRTLVLLLYHIDGLCLAVELETLDHQHLYETVILQILIAFFIKYPLYDVVFKKNILCVMCGLLIQCSTLWVMKV